jgi:hypothetical protein
MATAGSTDDDDGGPKDNIAEAESFLVEPDDDLRPDSRLYKKVKAFNAFIDESLRGLKPSEAGVWLVLFRFARDGVARVSQATVAERSGLSEKTVTRSIRALKRFGLVRIEHQGGLGKGANRYRLGIVTLEKAQRQAKMPHKRSAETAVVEPGDKNNKKTTPA